jgi:ubiquitin carboxyl-terminal hydrolase 7
LYLTIKVVTDETFQKHQGFDLATFKDGNWPSSELATFRELKQLPFIELKQRIATHFGQRVDHIRLWVLVKRQDATIRPHEPVPESDPNQSQ